VKLDLVLKSARAITWLRIGEVVDAALHPIARAITLRRIDRVVIGCMWLKVVDTHPENRIGMVLVQPDM
jgi:hypothetical protein